MKFKFTLIFLFFLSSINAQEEILKIEDAYRGSTFGLKKPIVIYDENSGNISISFSDDKNLNSHLFDENLKQIAEIKSKPLPKKYKSLLGYSIKNNVLSLYLSNKKHTKFGFYNFDYNTKKSSEEELKFEFSENEKYLQSISHNNKLFILSIIKDHSIINIYTFNDKIVDKHVIDLSKEKFFTKTNSTVPLYNLLDLNVVSSTKIDYKTLVSPKIAFSPTKIFINDEKLIITLDESFGFTQIITIDFVNYTSKVENVEQPYIKEESTFKNSNSYLHDKTLFQLASNDEKCTFSIKDLNSKKVIGEYTILKDGFLSIDSTNEVLTNKNIRNTNQFLRKNSKNKMGVSVYKHNDDYEIKIGSYEIHSSGGGMTPGLGTFSVGSNGNVVHTPGMPTFSLDSFTANDITEYTLNLVFDTTFNYQKDEEFKENAFDKIVEFKKKNSVSLDVDTDTVFIYKGEIVLGTVTLGSNLDFKLIKFTD